MRRTLTSQACIDVVEFDWDVTRVLISTLAGWQDCLADELLDHDTDALAFKAALTFFRLGVIVG